MVDVGHMNFFNVDQCGLYKVNKEDTHGVEINETFSLISDWASTRQLSATLPWDPSARQNKPKCYCKDIYLDEATGDYFLVLWKSDTDSAGTLWGAGEDSETGTGDVVKYTSEYNGKPVIWGRPSYYWVIPEHNTIASIKFDHSVSDAQMFEDYVKACINNRVPHEGRTKTFTEQQHVRISLVDDENNSCFYRFKKSLMSIDTSSAEMKKLAARVTHIIMRETIRVDAKNERNEWMKKFNEFILPFVSAKPRSKSRQIEIRAEAKPTPEEIKEIIENCATDGRKSGGWDNVGFDTEDGVAWVDKYRLRGHVSIVGEKEQLHSAKKLCTEIGKIRASLLAPITRAENPSEAEG